MASVLKATNEPALSNKWTFYGLAEEGALQWVDSHLHHADIWVGMDERLSMVFYAFHADESESSNRSDTYEPKPRTRFFLLTQAERLRHATTGLQLPAVGRANRIYDFGLGQLYHKRPVTPFQR